MEKDITHKVRRYKLLEMKHLYVFHEINEYFDLPLICYFVLER